MKMTGEKSETRDKIMRNVHKSPQRRNQGGA